MIRMMRDLFQVAVRAEVDVTRSALPTNTADLFDGAIGVITRDIWVLYSRSSTVYNLSFQKYF